MKYARLLLGMALFFIATLSNALDFPARPAGFVNDFVGKIGVDEQKLLNDRLGQFKKVSRVNIVIVTITSASDYGYPSGLVDLGVGLFDKWKPGEAATDSGILVIIAGKAPPYKVRIVTGRGAEGPVPDAIAKRIVEDTMKPLINSGNDGAYALGIVRGAEALMEQTKNEFAPKPMASKTSGSDDALLIFIVMCSTIVFIGLVLIYFLLYRPIKKIVRKQDHGVNTMRTEWQRPLPYTRTAAPSTSPVRHEPIAVKAKEEEPSSYTPMPDYDTPPSFGSSDPDPTPDFGGQTAGGGAGDN